MTEFLDANPILRYLLNDVSEHAPRARALIESERRFRVSVVTLVEVAFVLLRTYRTPREQIVDALVELLNRENIEAHEIDTVLAIEALMLCRPSGRVNFGDAMLWATAHSSAPARVWTFDANFPGDEVEVLAP
jgi:predicted nucleic acid-binding protein